MYGIGCDRIEHESKIVSKPNILIISLDTVSFDSTSLPDKWKNNTPFLKSAKKYGVNFLNAYSTYDSTPESHFSMLTGYLQGYQTNIDRQEESLAYQLRIFGYNTFGIAANGNLSQSACRYLISLEDYICLMDRPIKNEDMPEVDERINAYSGKINDFNRLFVYASCDKVIEQAKKKIKKAKKPFFGFININDAHDPYFPDPKIMGYEYENQMKKLDVPDLRFRILPRWLENPDGIMDLKFREYVQKKILQANSMKWATTLDLKPEVINVYKSRYMAEVREIDTGLKELYEYIQEEKIKDTIILITSDHGESFGELDLITHGFKNKGDWESTHHVPLIILFPKSYGIEKKVNIPCTIADIPPTIYDVVGINWQPLLTNAKKGNYGKSLYSYFESNISPRYTQTIKVDEKQGDIEKRRIQDKEANTRLKTLGYIK